MTHKELVESGLLEAYAIGEISNEHQLLIEKAIQTDPSIKNELKEIELALENYAKAHAVAPDPTVFPMLLAVKDFTERMQNGEQPKPVPFLSPSSKIEDYEEWITRDDLQEPSEYDSMHGKIIGSDEEKTTLIVWLKDGAPDETHTDEYEKFLILEGTCDITIGENIHSLKAGDFLAIPLFINHRVEVTSQMRCKVILERAAA